MTSLLAPQYGIEPAEAHAARQVRCCSQKVKHATRAAAKAHAVILGRKRRVKLKVYKCPTCGQFHLTKAENLRR